MSRPLRNPTTNYLMKDMIRCYDALGKIMEAPNAYTANNDPLYVAQKRLVLSLDKDYGALKSKGEANTPLSTVEKKHVNATFARYYADPSQRRQELEQQLDTLTCEAIRKFEKGPKEEQLPVWQLEPAETWMLRRGPRKLKIEDITVYNLAERVAIMQEGDRRDMTHFNYRFSDSEKNNYIRKI